MESSSCHPCPHFFEISSCGFFLLQYNSDYVDQVAAMEQRAHSVGMGGKIYYMFPSNGYLNDADGDRAEQLGLGDHLLADLHVGGGGAVGESQSLFAQHPNWFEAMGCLFEGSFFVLFCFFFCIFVVFLFLYVVANVGLSDDQKRRKKNK